MGFSPNTIFISYSRADGRNFAEAFERRLEHEGIRSWRDLKSMEAGDIRPQVLRAIEDAKHFVLILSRQALTSDWIKREWSHARMVGKRVSPVLADPTLKRADLPPWMRREEVFDIDPKRDRGAERWKALVLVLRGDGRTKRAPYMPGGDLPPEFVPRPAEYAALKAAVLAEAPEKTVALTTALRGAGGYGKTILANCLCRDPDVRFEFSDGIVRVEVGKERGDVTGLISDLIERLDAEGKRPGSTDVVTASEYLGELIGESRLLLVIDDVWREAQLRPFLRGGPNCVRLVTTRLPRVLQAVRHTEVLIDEMRAAEAARLITMNLPVAGEPGAAARLADLADRLGNWAQMLAIANGWLRDRVEKRERLADAIARFERRLAKDGPFVFDPENEPQRNRAIRLCVEASVEDLDAAKTMRFGELAILPEDKDVPLSVIEALWAQTGGVDEDGTDDLVRRLDALSLLQSLDLGARTLRLHDNIIWYLRDKIATEGCRTAHAAMVRAIGARRGGGWETLPPADIYGWRLLIRHLRGAGRDEEADRLLTNYAWIKAKLSIIGPWELFADYLPEPIDEGARLIGRAIALSLPALGKNIHELPRQLFGRLGGLNQETAAAVVAAAQHDPLFHPAPRWPGLTPPGPERLRLVGHESWLHGAVFFPDSTRIATASDDHTARIWDTTTGREIITLRGHAGQVQSSAFSPDGVRIVTASRDGTARIWDVITGRESSVLLGHEDGVLMAAFSPGGARVVTASYDRTAQIWDALTGRQIITLLGHAKAVRSAAFSPDGALIVTASDDRTARIWNTATGQQITALSGHEDEVNSAAFDIDGARIVTASDDHTVRIWERSTGRVIAVLRGHEDWVLTAAFSPDGARIVTASRDRTARIWDATTGREITALSGHDFGVQSAAFSPDCASIVTSSDDCTARVWETQKKRRSLLDTGMKAGWKVVPTSRMVFASLQPRMTGRHGSGVRSRERKSPCCVVTSCLC